MLGVGLLLSSIGYILGRKMLGEMGVEIRLIVIASIISAVPTFFVRLEANYEGIYQKKESNTQEKESNTQEKKDI